MLKQNLSAHRNNRRRRTSVLLKTGCLAHAKHSDNPLPRILFTACCLLERGRGSYVGKGGRVVMRVIAVGYCVPALLALVHYFNCMSCLTNMNISLAGEGGILMRPQ